MATNPQNFWESDPVAPANDPNFGGFIQGPPKTAAPKTTWQTLTADQARSAGLDTKYTWQRSSEGETKKVGDAEDEGKDVLKQAINNMSIDELLASVEKARKLVASGYATGWGGSFSKVANLAGGGTRNDFLGQINAIQGGIINEKLQALKDASKTGASGLGALSEKEGERLASSVAALNPSMSKEATLDSLDAIAQHANMLRAVRDGKDPNDPAVMKAYGLHPLAVNATDTGGGGDGGSGGTPPPGPPPGISAMTPEQVTRYNQFWKDNPQPSADQLQGFLSGLLGKPITPESAQQIVQHAAKGGGFSTNVDNPDYAKKVADRAALNKKLGLNSDALTTTAMQAATLNLSDEAAGVGNALGSFLPNLARGQFHPGEDYSIGRDVERQNVEDARKQLGYGAIPVDIVAGAAGVGPASAIDAITARQAVTGGATVGALAGFGSGQGAQQSLTGAGVGGAGGAAVSALAPFIPHVLPKRFRPPQGMAPDVAAAAKAEGVDLIKPMVDENAIGDFGAMESNVYSAPIIRGATGRVRGQIEDRAVALGADGTPLDTAAAGATVQSAGRRFIQRSKAVANRLYSRAESLSQGKRFVPNQAIGQVDAEISQLQANPETNAGEISFLQGLRNDLSTPGGKTVEELRQLRTSLRGRVSEQNLSKTQAEARAIRALDATQQDVAANAPAAASAYKRADTYYRERQTHIDDIIERITGGNVGDGNFQVSGEQAFSRLKSMTSPGGDGRRLAALMRDLEPAERQDIAATIASNLGREASDTPFSTRRFLTQTAKLSPSARRTIFGPDGAQSIANLRLLSQKLENAEKDINRSRSATVLERQGWRNVARSVIATIAGLGGQAATGHIAGGVAAAGVAGAAMGASATRRVLSARAMVNPRVSRWLAETADITTQKQANNALKQLGTIIAREPALVHELQPLYNSLQDRLTVPLAAQPNSEGQQNE